MQLNVEQEQELYLNNAASKMASGLGAVEQEQELYLNELTKKDNPSDSE